MDGAIAPPRPSLCFNTLSFGLAGFFRSRGNRLDTYWLKKYFGCQVKYGAAGPISIWTEIAKNWIQIAWTNIYFRTALGAVPNSSLNTLEK